MLSKLAACGLCAVALLHAQQLTDVERKFFASADDALGLHPGAVIADIGTGHSLVRPYQIAEKVGPGILVSDSYHEFSQPSAMLKHFYKELKPNGRLVVLELYSDAHKNESRADQVKRHDIAPDILERELSAAGFVIKERLDSVPLNADRCRCLFRAEK